MASRNKVANDRGSKEYTTLLRTEVDDVIGKMEANVSKLNERGSKIGIGEETVLKIKEDAKTFKELALENKKKHMWENFKMTALICISIGLICILVLIIMFYND